MEMYEKVLQNALIYGFEEGIGAAYREHGLNISKFEDWPPEKINWVPEEAKAKLIPPIQNLFRSFKQNLK